MSAAILVVDDEPAILDAIAYTLRGEGFDVDVASSGEEAFEAADRRPYEVVVLDVMLPGVSGVELCRRLRAESDVPILLLTARDAEVDRVLGLEAGADDYVTRSTATSYARGCAWAASRSTWRATRSRWTGGRCGSRRRS